MLGFYDAWEEADKLKEQSREEACFYDAWKEADKLEEHLNKEKRRRIEQPSCNSAAASLAQHARAAASLMMVAEQVAAKDELSSTEDEYDMFMDQCQWEEMIKHETDELRGQCKPVAESDKTWVQVKEEIPWEENASASQGSQDLSEKNHAVLLDKLLRDALIERAQTAQQHSDANVSVQGSQSKASAVPPPRPHQVHAKCSSAPKNLPPLPPPKHPPPVPPIAESQQAPERQVPPIAQPQQAPARVRGLAGKEHEGRYYVPCRICFNIFTFSNMLGLSTIQCFYVHHTATP